MTSRTSLFSVCAALTMLLSGCGAPIAPIRHSSISTVEIPQTPVKNQYKVGFCWAYSTAGLIESTFLNKTGMEVDISEEAIGFYRIAEELYYLSQNNSGADLNSVQALRSKTFEDLQGWDLIFTPHYGPLGRMPGSLEIVEKWGVVPESVWSYKFQNGLLTNLFFSRLEGGFVSLMRDKKAGELTMDEIFAFLASEDLFKSRPPTEFSFALPGKEAQKYNAVDFLKNTLGFDRAGYVVIEAAAQPQDYANIVGAIKETLASGLVVPMGYPVDDNWFNRSTSTFTGAGKNPDSFRPEGGHAVLITDFVNVGGKPGAVDPAVLAAEVAKDPEQLDYLVFKNSWGTTLGTPADIKPGFYLLDKPYLKASLVRPGENTFVVPRTIAERHSLLKD